MSALQKPFSKDPVIEKSLHHSIKDGVAFSIMTGVGENYFSAYAVFLKASTQQVGLLAALPPLLAAFTQMLAVVLGQLLGVRKGIIVAGASIQIVGLLAIACLPSLFPAWSFPLLLLSVILYFSGANLGAPLWGSLMGVLVPENVRGRFFSRRTRLSSVASFSSLLGAGTILQLFDSLGYTLYGFLLIFGIGMLARAYSTYQLTQLYDPPRTLRSAPRHEQDGIPGPALLRQHPNFLRFSLFFALMQFAVAISGPFVVVYLLRDLHFSYLQLTLNTAASVLMQFLVLSRWGRLGDLFGNRIILRLTGYTIPLIPALWVLSSDFYYLLLIQMISGLVWSGYSLSTSNFLFDLTPSNRRAGMMAAHNLFGSVAVFLGASVGSALALILPTSIAFSMFSLDISFGWSSVFYGVFLFSALTRLCVALLFLPHIEEVRSVKPMSYHGLAFRVTRFSPISGVIFEIISRNRNHKDDDNTDA
ncbi:MAG: MFS transporter [Pseudomonadales bacterium]|nr:MFS transporter [Pseudomonadales bacterium]MDP4875463.1 MFS transporter [Pseudomonadales bacterium]MDP4910610.1 MFS transporter [Pseudomonadales bacterium]